MSDGPLIHIGFSKTATTFVQSCFFARHPGLNYLGQPATDDDVVEFMREVRWRDSLQYNPSRVRALFDAGFAPAMAGGKLAAISNEGFSIISGTDRGLVAQRLHDFFPEARIMITIREQMRYVESLYHALTEPEYKQLRAFPTFARFVREDLGLNQARSHIHGACYDPLVAHYQSLFGKDKVLVLPMEYLRADAGGFFEAICAFAGIDTWQPVNRPVNARVSRRQLRVARWASRSWLLRGAMLGVQRAWPRGWRKLVSMGPPATVTWPAGLREQARALYAPSNARLAQLTGIDLASLGYTMPESVGTD